MTSPFTALLDACVLYSAPVRDLLLQLATTQLFRARWTEAIHEEWMRAVLKERTDLKREQLERVKRLMDAHAEGCLVTGYELLIESVTLPDAKDRHVLAAAIRGRADVIVTFNLKHFPPLALEPFEVEVQHPDEFIGHLVHLAPQAVCSSARTVRARLRNPPIASGDYIDRLRRNQLVETAAFLSENSGII